MLILFLSSLISFFLNLLDICLQLVLVSVLQWVLGSVKPQLVFFSSCSSFVFACFLNAFPRWEYVNLACFIIWLWLEGYVSSPVGYWYLSILSNENADAFTVSLLMSYWRFSSLIFSLIVLITFYILCKSLPLKHKDCLMWEYYHWLIKDIVLQYIFCKVS